MVAATDKTYSLDGTMRKAHTLLNNEQVRESLPDLDWDVTCTEETRYTMEVATGVVDQVLDKGGIDTVKLLIIEVLKNTGSTDNVKVSVNGPDASLDREFKVGVGLALMDSDITSVYISNDSGNTVTIRVHMAG